MSTITTSNRWDLEPTREPLRSRQPRLNTKEITAACGPQNASDKVVRQRVAKTLQAARVKDWQETEPRGSVDARDQSRVQTNSHERRTEPDPALSMNSTDSKDSSDQSRVQTNSHKRRTAPDPALSRRAALDPAPLTNTTGSRDSSDQSRVHDDPATDAEEDEIPIDPALLDDTVDVLTGRGIAPLDPETVTDMLTTASESTSTRENTSRMASIERYAAINVVCFSGVQAKSFWDTMAAKPYWSAECKSPVTRFMLTCPYRRRGCNYTSSMTAEVQKHQVNCADALADSRPRTYTCPRENCDAAFKGRDTLAAHIRGIHEWTPKKCETPGPECTDRVFVTHSAYQLHQATYHRKFPSPWKKQTCSVPQCSSTREFASLFAYKSHLSHAHKLSRTKWNDYLPEACHKRPSRLPPWKNQRCSVPQCSSTHTFTSSRAYKGHLKKVHKLSAATWNDYLPQPCRKAVGSPSVSDEAATGSE